MRSDTFDCARCNGTFEKARPDAVTDEEARLLFGIEAATQKADAYDDSVDSLCEDCFKTVYIVA